MDKKKWPPIKKWYILFFSTISKESHNKSYVFELTCLVLCICVNKICDFKSRIRKIDMFTEFLLKIKDGGFESEMYEYRWIISISCGFTLHQSSRNDLPKGLNESGGTD